MTLDPAKTDPIERLVKMERWEDTFIWSCRVEQTGIDQCQVGTRKAECRQNYNTMRIMSRDSALIRRRIDGLARVSCNVVRI